MVALLETYASKNEATTKNRVGDFFVTRGDFVGETSLQVLDCTREIKVFDQTSRWSPPLSQKEESGGSGLGNLLRKTPYLGGLLGAVGDTISGATNAITGLATFGFSGTLGKGLSQFRNGVSDIIEITAKDAFAAAIGLSIGTIVSTATWAKSGIQSLSRGNLLGFGRNMGAMMVDLVIPEYGWWEPQKGSNANP